MVGLCGCGPFLLLLLHFCLLFWNLALCHDGDAVEVQTGLRMRFVRPLYLEMVSRSRRYRPWASQSPSSLVPSSDRRDCLGTRLPRRKRGGTNQVWTTNLETPGFTGSARDDINLEHGTLIEAVEVGDGF